MISTAGILLKQYSKRSLKFDLEFLLSLIINLSSGTKIGCSGTQSLQRKDTPFWKYQLPKGKHKVYLKILNPNDKAEIELADLIIYSDEPSRPLH